MRKLWRKGRRLAALGPARFSRLFPQEALAQRGLSRVSLSGSFLLLAMADSTSPSPSRSFAGRLWIMAMGLVVAAAGWIFVQYLWGSYERAKAMEAWEEVPCVVASSQLADGGLNQRGLPKYLVSVRYRYEIDGQTYESERLRRLPVEASDLRKAEARLRPFPEGLETVCFVDPDDPAMAVLERDSRGALYSIWFPWIFVVGGLVMAVSAFVSQVRACCGR